jgi:hypothetical protein
MRARVLGQLWCFDVFGDNTMSSRQLMGAAWAYAVNQYQDLHQDWTNVSGRLMSKGLSVVSIQDLGHMDILVRSMEDEFNVDSGIDVLNPINMGANTLHGLLSVYWISSAYEIFRVINQCKSIVITDEFKRIFHNLTLLRIGLVKHEIANERCLRGLDKVKLCRNNNDSEADYLVYNLNAPDRSMILPFEITHRGSFQWHVIDLKNNNSSFWVERRTLSEEIIALGLSEEIRKPREEL